MEDKHKKISFGFNKLLKRSNIIVKQQPVEENKVEIIKYLEEKSIKVEGENDNKPKGPLIIPMKEPNKKLVNLVDLMKNEQNVDAPECKETSDEGRGNTESGDLQNEAQNLSLEEQAARELLNDSKNFKSREIDKRVIGIPKNAETATLEGEKESTIEDYEEIPIEEFGKALLRGMGWKDGQGIGKKQELLKMSQPVQRPKGMGLGADKMTKIEKSETAVDRDGNTLKCLKGSFIKVIAGYHEGNYGQIIGFDDESGRFIIKLAVNNLNVSLNEFLVTPVTKEEFNKNSRIINRAKYEEYLKKNELKEMNQQSKSRGNEKSVSNNEEIYRKRHKEDRDNKNKNYYCDKEDYRENEDNKRSIKKEKSSKKHEAHRKDKSYSDIEMEKQSSDSECEATPTKKYNKSKSSLKSDSKNYREKEKRNRKDDFEYKKNKSKYYSDDSSSDYSEPKRNIKSHSSNSKDKNHDRKNRNEVKKNKSKIHSNSSSSEDKYERNKSKVSKYSDSDDNCKPRTGHKKKKNKEKYSPEYSNERSKKSDSKKYDYESVKNTRVSKDKYSDKRDRSTSRHDKN